MDPPAVTALEKRLLASLQHVNELPGLISLVSGTVRRPRAEAVKPPSAKKAKRADGAAVAAQAPAPAEEETVTVPLPTRHAALKSARHVFTHYFHTGVIAGRAVVAGGGSEDAAPLAGKKRKAVAAEGEVEEGAAPTGAGASDPAAVLGRWLRAQFFDFLGIALDVIANEEADKAAAEEDEEEEGEGAGTSAAALRVACLSTIAHFLAHAVPEAQQVSERGHHLCTDVLTWFLRRVLAADPLAPGASKAERARARGLLSALTGFRLAYIDDHDDVRFHVLRVVAALAAAKKARRGSSSSRSAVAASSSSSSLAVFDAAPLAVFTRNAVDLLLQISLPLTDADWEAGFSAAAAEHGHGRSSWVREAWEPVLDAPTLAAWGALGGGPAVPRAAPAAKGKVYSRAADSDDDDSDGEAGLAAALAAMKKKEAEAAAAAAAKAAAAAAAGGDFPRAPYAELAEQRKAFCAAWVGVLKLAGVKGSSGAGEKEEEDEDEGAATSVSASAAFARDTVRRILAGLPTSVLPHLPSPHVPTLLFADFLTAACDAGGPDALLALHSLFILQQKHGLEYPRFYPRVYALLGDPRTLHAKHRARFFSLLDLFLTSVALPAYLVAAFVKRAARLTLTAPVPAALFLLPFVYNAVKRHPAVTPLLHRVGAPGANGGGAAWPARADPFDASTDEPASAAALESSLWEVAAATQHVAAPVASLARRLWKETTKAEYDILDFTGNTYAGLIENELGRTLKIGGKLEAPEVAWAFTTGGAGAGAGGGRGEVKRVGGAPSTFDAVAGF